MRYSNVEANQGITAQQINLLGADATGGGNLLAHQTLGLFSFGTNPTTGKTVTLTINTVAITITFVNVIGSTPGNVLIAGTAAGTVANLINLLINPQVTNANQVALSGANQTLVGYLDFDQSGATLAVSSVNNLTYAPLTSFTAATNATSDTWTPSTMTLYVEDGFASVNGTEVYFTGHVTPLVTAPVSHPRIDLLTMDSTGTLAWVTGVEGTSPATPAYPNNKLVICELWNVVGETQLLDNLNQSAAQGFILNDTRPFLQLPFYPLSFGSDFIPDADGTRNLGSLSFEWENIYAKGGIFLNGVAVNANLFTSLTAGQSVTPGKPVSVLPYPAASIGFDNNLFGSGTGTTINSSSLAIGAHSNKLLTVFAFVTSSSAHSISSMAFNGASMANYITGTGAGNSLKFYVFYLIGPTTGTLSISTNNASCAVTYYVYSNYNCAQQAPSANAVANNNVGGAQPSASLTPLSNACAFIGAISGGSVTGVPALNQLNSGNAGQSGEQVAPGLQTIAFSSNSNNEAILIEIDPVVSGATPRVYPTSTAIALTCASYIGIAQGTATVGNPVTIVTDGVDQNQLGLAIGGQYYLADSPGTFSLSPGTVTRKAGIAVDTTKLVITNDW